VLQVVLSLNPGGTERLVMELASRLHAELPTMVCCLDEAGAWAADLEARGIRVRALGRQNGFRPALGRAVAAVAKEHDATVMHAHQYSPFVYSALARLWRPRTKVVFTEHGRLSDAPPSGKRRRVNRLLRRVPARMFAVSGNLKSHMLGEGFLPDDISVIYNGIDVGPVPDMSDCKRMRELLGVGNQTFVVGTVARLDPVKDLGTLIRAIAKLTLDVTSRSFGLVVIGSGPEQDALERLAAELGVHRQVRFLGHRDDARDWLAACDAYVNCSISEGVSLTILEAMAAGLPVVATAVGGTPEVVDASCGRLVPARNPDALASAIAEIAAAPRLALDLGREARTRVETKFTLDRMIGEYRDVYEKLGT